MTVVYVYDEYASTFEVEVKDGFAAADAIIEGVESGPQAGSAHPSWRVYTSTPIGNIPPWSANGLRINDLPAPEGSGSNMPPVSGPSQSQSPSTPAPSTSAPPAAAVDINELTFNADAISLSAKLNGDGTITYTYKDTSLKPAYSCDGEVFFSIEVQGMDAEMSIITDANFTPYGNDFEPLDLAGMVGLVSTGGSIPVTVDDNGLTATWQCRALGGTELENLEMFSITYTLNVGGEIVFSEWVRFGAGLVLQ